MERELEHNESSIFFVVVVRPSSSSSSLSFPSIHVVIYKSMINLPFSLHLENKARDWWKCPFPTRALIGRRLCAFLRRRLSFLFFFRFCPFFSISVFLYIISAVFSFCHFLRCSAFFDPDVWEKVPICRCLSMNGVQTAVQTAKCKRC